MLPKINTHFIWLKIQGIELIICLYFASFSVGLIRVAVNIRTLLPMRDS